MRILVVDDYSDTREAIVSMLTHDAIWDLDCRGGAAAELALKPVTVEAREPRKAVSYR